MDFLYHGKGDTEPPKKFQRKTMKIVRRRQKVDLGILSNIPLPISSSDVGYDSCSIGNSGTGQAY